MNLALWFVLGSLVAGINSALQKWSVDRMQPDSIKTSRLLLVFGLALRFIIFGTATFIAMRAGSMQLALCVIGVFVGKWVMLLFWLNKQGVFQKG